MPLYIFEEVQNLPILQNIKITHIMDLQENILNFIINKTLTCVLL
jgi:hypothetical protein